MLKNAIKRYINNLPYVKSLIDEVNLYKLNHFPGHYYSPIVSVEQIKKRESEIFSISSNKVDGIDLNETGQVNLLHDLAKGYASVPFSDEKQNELRYYFNNDFY